MVHSYQMGLLIPVKYTEHLDEHNQAFRDKNAFKTITSSMIMELPPIDKGDFVDFHIKCMISQQLSRDFNYIL